MGRSIVADERVQKIIDSFKVTKGCIIGLLIGQLTQQRDYVIHLCETPNDPDDEAGNENAKKETDPRNIDDRWVATHAKQVLHMLPGGFDILGIFIVSTQEMMTNAQSQFRKVLNAVQKVVDKSQAVIPDNAIHMERVVLQICVHTKKTTCRTYDMSDIKSTARPADWKVQSVASGWITVESSLSVEHFIPISIQSMSVSTGKQIQTGISSLLPSVGTCLAMFDGKIMDPKENIINTAPPQQTKKSKKGATGSKSMPVPSHKVQVQMLMRTPPLESGNITSTDCGAKMLLKGTMTGRAFVHGKSTYEDALNALKKDFCRSLIARCELLVEDLLQAEEEQDPKVLYETPVRVLGQIPDSQQLSLCDYMFPDEEVTNSLDRFSEILGLTLSEEDLVTDLENLPNEESLAQLYGVTADVGEDKQPPSKRRVYDTVGIVGSAVAALAALMYYMFLGES